MGTYFGSSRLNPLCSCPMCGWKDSENISFSRWTFLLGASFGMVSWWGRKTKSVNPNAKKLLSCEEEEKSSSIFTRGQRKASFQKWMALFLRTQNHHFVHIITIIVLELWGTRTVNDTQPWNPTGLDNGSQIEVLQNSLMVSPHNNLNGKNWKKNSIQLRCCYCRTFPHARVYLNSGRRRLRFKW